MTPNIGSLAQRVLLIGLLVAACGVQAGPAVQAWVQRYNGPVNDYDESVAVAVGRAGDILVGGSSIGSKGYLEYTTIDYSSAGLPLWTNRYDGPGHAYNLLTSMAVDATSGNVYVVGGSFGTNGGDDFATLAYSSAGKPLWTNRYNARFYNSAGALGVAVGPEGNVYVAGSVVGAGYATVAYTSTGTALWTNLYAATNYSTGDIAEAIAVDPWRIFVTGWSDPGDGTADFATVAYYRDGKPLWTNRYDGPANGIDVALAMAGDRAGHIFVTGYSEGSGSHLDYATIAYSSEGAPLWTNRYNGSGNSTDIARALAVDGNGRVYVTGYSYNSGATFEFATIAYSSEGAALWTNRYKAPGPLDSGAAAVAVDGCGRVIVAGSSYATGRFNDDFATVAYGADGSALWTNRYNGPANGYDYVDSKYGLAVGLDGAIYVAGSPEGVHEGLTNADFALIKYVTPPDILLSSLQRLPGACRFTISAPVSTPYRLEASADLTNWEGLTNFPPLPVPSIDYTDTLAPGFVQRYYRAVWSP